MTKVLSGIGYRFKKIRKYSNQTQKEFAATLNITQAALSKYENEELQIPDEVKEILFKNGININWLLTGEGEMFRQKEDDYDKIKKENEELKKQLEELKNAIFYKVKQNGEIVQKNIESNDNSIIQVDMSPFLASAGPGQDITNNFQLIKTFPILKDLIFEPGVKAIEARGESMTGISIYDSDIVFFKPEVIRGDGIYVIKIGNDVLIKRLIWEHTSQKVAIISENKLYPDEIRIQKVDPDVLQILGKVIGWIHKHPY